MKFLSSSSSSSSSTTSFDHGNICNSKSATVGCIAGVFRRLLCSGSLPTYPSDNIITETNSVEFDKIQDLKDKEKAENSVGPGLVARLMGLDSMPNSIVRSRSMNSVDHWPECDAMQSKHRRVKTSLSFREMPTFLEREDEEFFVLCFENGGEIKEFKSNERKFEMGFGELKQRKTERCKNRENRGESLHEKKKKNYSKEDQQSRKKVSTEKENLNRNCKIKDLTNILRTMKDSQARLHVVSEIAQRPKPMNHKEVCDATKLRRKKKKKKNHSAASKVELDCSSEDSSPVSVLNFNEFLEVPTSEEDSRLMSSNSRRKLLPQEENYEQPSPRNTNNVVGEDYDGEIKANEGKRHGLRKKDYQSEDYLNMWDEISRLVEEEMMESNWIFKERGKLEDFENVDADFGVQILDQLLNELVDQLVESPMKNFYL